MQKHSTDFGACRLDTFANRQTATPQLLQTTKHLILLYGYKEYKGRLAQLARAHP